MLKITGIPAFDDNYIWLIHPDESSKIYVVDPGDATVVIDHLEKNQLTLAGILITHHHHDHTGGINQLQQVYNHKLDVFGPEVENISGVTVPLTGDQDIQIPGFKGRTCIIKVPGHTKGHVAYLHQGNLFCGDTLFSGGCGRLFEGTAEQMLASLTKLADFPANTKVYCAHEYTQSNLAFALEVEPNNPHLIEYNHWVKKARAHNMPTIPSDIATELKINPFLRCHLPEIQKSIARRIALAAPTELETFTQLRRWKDNF